MGEAKHERVVDEIIRQRDDLLEACETVLKHLDYLQELWGKEGVTNTVAESVRAAVARAKGVSE